MARVLIAPRSPIRAADATRQAVELLGPEHRMIVLLVTRPFPVPVAVSGGGGLSAARFEMNEGLEPDFVLDAPGGTEADLRSELDEATLNLHLEKQLRLRIESGDPVEIFCLAAVEERADLIVIARRSRKLAGRLLRESVTRRVLERASCPVLVVHERDR